MTSRSRKDHAHAIRRHGSTNANAEPRHPSGTLLAILLLIALSIAWIALSRSAFFVGPSEWDDNAYTDVAALPREKVDIASRFIHIWTLRLFNLVMATRQSAGALYPTLVTVALSWLGFFLGRRMGGTWCGLLAALLMPFYPALLKYLTVPYCDPPMVLWGGLAVLCALAGADSKTRRWQMAAAAASGLFFLLSTQCKETGAAFLPAVIVALWACPGKAKIAAAFFGGALAGWLLLSLLDWIFIDDFCWHWHLSTYFHRQFGDNGGGAGGGGGGKAAYRLNAHFVQFLLTSHIYTGEFLMFTVLGVAGAVAGYRTHLAVRVVAVWCFSALAFSSFMSVHFHGVNALDRYCAAMGVPLVALSAFWAVRVWQCPTGFADKIRGYLPVILALIIIITYGAAMYGLLRVELTRPGADPTERFPFFLMPPAFLLLFLIPWLAPGRWFCRVSLVLIFIAAAGLNVRTADWYMTTKRSQLAPWVALTRAMDDSAARLVKWNLPRMPYTEFRIARRIRTLSRRPASEIKVRELKSLSDIREDDWIFSSPKAWDVLRGQGWIPVRNDDGTPIAGGQEGVTFVVYRKANPTEP